LKGWDKEMANDLLGNLKAYFTKITEGEHTPAEMASALNTWLKESGESIKTKVEEEVHHAVAKMGFIKREEFDALKREVESLSGKPIGKKSPFQKATVKKSTPKKSTAKRAPTKKSAVKKTAKRPAKVASRTAKKTVKKR
jgi:hypothetical protein